MIRRRCCHLDSTSIPTPTVEKQKIRPSGTSWVGLRSGKRTSTRQVLPTSQPRLLTQRSSDHPGRYPQIARRPTPDSTAPRHPHVGLQLPAGRGWLDRDRRRVSSSRTQQARPRQRHSSVARRHQAFAAVAAATAALGPNRRPGSAWGQRFSALTRFVPLSVFAMLAPALRLPTCRSRGCAAARRSCWSAGWIRWCGPRGDRVAGGLDGSCHGGRWSVRIDGWPGM